MAQSLPDRVVVTDARGNVIHDSNAIINESDRRADIAGGGGSGVVSRVGGGGTPSYASREQAAAQGREEQRQASVQQTRTQQLQTQQEQRTAAVFGQQIYASRPGSYGAGGYVNPYSNELSRQEKIAAGTGLPLKTVQENWLVGAKFSEKAAPVEKGADFGSSKVQPKGESVFDSALFSKAPPKGYSVFGGFSSAKGFETTIYTNPPAQERGTFGGMKGSPVVLSERGLPATRTMFSEVPAAGKTYDNSVWGTALKYSDEINDKIAPRVGSAFEFVAGTANPAALPLLVTSSEYRGGVIEAGKRVITGGSPQTSLGSFVGEQAGGLGGSLLRASQAPYIGTENLGQDRYGRTPRIKSEIMSAATDVGITGLSFGAFGIAGKAFSRGAPRIDISKSITLVESQKIGEPFSPSSFSRSTALVKYEPTGIKPPATLEIPTTQYTGRVFGEVRVTQTPSLVENIVSRVQQTKGKLMAGNKLQTNLMSQSKSPFATFAGEFKTTSLDRPIPNARISIGDYWQNIDTITSATGKVRFTKGTAKFAQVQLSETISVKNPGNLPVLRGKTPLDTTLSYSYGKIGGKSVESISKTVKLFSADTKFGDASLSAGYFRDVNKLGIGEKTPTAGVMINRIGKPKLDIAELFGKETPIMRTVKPTTPALSMKAPAATEMRYSIEDMVRAAVKESPEFKAISKPFSPTKTYFSGAGTATIQRQRTATASKEEQGGMLSTMSKTEFAKAAGSTAPELRTIEVTRSLAGIRTGITGGLVFKQPTAEKSRTFQPQLMIMKPIKLPESIVSRSGVTPTERQKIFQPNINTITPADRIISLVRQPQTTPQRITEKQRTDWPPYVPVRQKLDIPDTPFRMMLPPFRDLGGGSSKKKPWGFKAKPQKYRYTPSIIANISGIRAKLPKGITSSKLRLSGLEIRPVALGKRGRLRVPFMKRRRR